MLAHCLCSLRGLIGQDSDSKLENLKLSNLPADLYKLRSLANSAVKGLRNTTHTHAMDRVPHQRAIGKIKTVKFTGKSCTCMKCHAVPCFRLLT